MKLAFVAVNSEKVCFVLRAECIHAIIILSGRWLAGEVQTKREAALCPILRRRQLLRFIDSGSVCAGCARSAARRRPNSECRPIPRGTTILCSLVGGFSPDHHRVPERSFQNRSERRIEARSIRFPLAAPVQDEEPGAQFRGRLPDFLA